MNTQLAVPRFFFHVRDDLDSPDHEGSEQRDIEAARTYAAGSARCLMCETLMREGRITLHHRIEIEDDRGGVLDTVHFRDAVTVEP